MLAAARWRASTIAAAAATTLGRAAGFRLAQTDAPTWVPATSCAETAATAGAAQPTACAVSLCSDVVPWMVLVGQSGVPKKKNSVGQWARKYNGIHFKHRSMRLQSWYYCPLCAEPKQQGQYCRREDCRKIKP